MALSQTDIDRLESALVKGTLSVEIDGQKIVYRSVSELRSALDYAKSQVAGSSSTAPASVAFASFRKS